MPDILIRRLHSSGSESPLLEILLERSLEITGAAFGNVQTMNWETGYLEIAAQRGFNAEFLKFFEQVGIADGSACALALRERGAVIIEDVTDSTHFSSLGRVAVLNAGVRAVQSVPILSTSDALVGMLSVHFPEKHCPSLSETDTLKALAKVAADVVISRRARQDQPCAVARTQRAIATSRELLLRIGQSDLK